MSLPILQIKRRNVAPASDWASGGQPNGLIAGELGYNYYNGTLWIGPNGDKDGKGYSILLNRDRRITAANWKNGTVAGPILEFTEYDQNGYLRSFSSSAIPVAGDGHSGVIKVGGIQDFVGTKIFASDGSLSTSDLGLPLDIDITIGAEGGIIQAGEQSLAGLAQGMVAAVAWDDDADLTDISALTPYGLILSNGLAWTKISNNYNANVTKIAHFISDLDGFGDKMQWATPADLVAAGISTGAGLTQEANIIKHINSIAAGTISGSSSTGLSFGSTINIPSITYDNTGHISSVTTTSVKLPTISAASATTSTAAALVAGVALSAAGKLTTTTFTGNLGGETTFVYFNEGVPTAASTTIGSKTKPVYVSSGKITAGTTYAGGTKVTLNGSSKSGSTASFYAPTAAGTAANQLLVWDAENSIPVWKAQSELDGFLTSVAFGASGDAGRTLTLTLANGTEMTATIPSTIGGFSTIASNSFEGALKGNADTATKAGQFTSAAKIELTGDVTGSASSTHGWKFATTLASTGVAAGEYGPALTTNPGFGGSYAVPYIKVDAKGRILEAATYNLQLPELNLKATSSNSTTAATFVSGLSLSATGALSITKYNGTLGSDTKHVYLKAGVPTESLYAYAGGSLVNLNGADKVGAKATFFAPTAGGTANQILKSNGASAPTWINQSAITAGKATADASGNTITTTYETKSAASSKLETAKAWATTEAERVKDELLNGAGDAYDTLQELSEEIIANDGAIAALEAVAATKAAKATKIIAGAGLTGGGTLEADRTIAHSNSVTARTSGTQNTATPGLGGTFKITEPKYDAQGHITGIHQATITMPDIGTVTDDNIVNITVAPDDSGNNINVSASHANVFGTNKTYASANTTTSISGPGGTGTIKIPQISVNSQGHVTAAADEEVTITMPSMTGSVPAGTLQLVSAVSASGATLSGSKKTLTAGTNIALTDTNSKITIGLTGIVAVANGGTGNDTQIANRLIYSESDSKLSSSGHYASSTKLGINTTSVDSDYTFKVNGATAFSSGHIYLTGATTTSVANTTQIIFGTPSANHIALSSNDKAFIINPTSSSTDSQIVLYLNKQSSFPAGISGGASQFTSITGPLKGNADTATKLKNPQTISFSGDVVSTSVSFDGSADKSVTITLANSGVTAGSYGQSTAVSPGHSGTFTVPYVTVDAKGRVTSISNKTITLPSDNNTTYSAGNGLSLSSTTFSVKAGTGIAVSSSGVALATSGATAGSYGPSSSVSPGHSGTFSVPYVTVDTYGRVTSISSQTITLPGDNNTDTKVTQSRSTTSNWRPILSHYTHGTYGTDPGSATGAAYYHESIAMSPSTGSIKASLVYGAVWNDYAEYRAQKEKVEPGYCVVSNDKGQVSKTTRKYQVCDGIVSDTFGFAIGETDDCKTPLAVSGRVLAYCEGSKYDYHAGDTVCAGPNGKIIKMTREEIREWPDRIVGTVSEIPEYETWGTGNVKVNGRIWIKVK